MSPRKRVLRALTRRVPDKVPKEFGCTPEVYKLVVQKIGEVDIPEYFGFEMRRVKWEPTKYRRDFSAYLGESSQNWLDTRLFKEENGEEVILLPFPL